MPLYKSDEVTPGTRLYIWKIIETEEELACIPLKEACVGRALRMKNAQHRKGFLSVRWLLKEAGYTDFDLHYDADGKPYLEDGNYISITHSYGFSAIIVSNKNVGIDMELRREKVITIADKFIDKEFEYLNPGHLGSYMKMLIVIWGVKEAVFKMISRDGLSFKQHMNVLPFTYLDTKGTAKVNFMDIANNYTFFFEEIEDFTLVYSFEN